MKESENKEADGVSRRGFLKGASISVAAGSVLSTAGLKQEKAAAKSPTKLAAAKAHPLHFELNGSPVETSVRTGHTLLETLRDQLDMTGTKLVCDFGACGACTVIVDGRPVNSCLTLAVDAEGTKIETIEGLASNGKLHPVQQGFIEEDGLQCGFCTPGMIMSCKALLDKNPKPSREECQSALAGNICRCGTYFNIFRAVDRASDLMKRGK